MYNNRHKVPVSTNLLLLKGNSILLSLRHHTKSDKNLWGLIAGHLEPKESITSCMIREAKEELGIDIERDDLIAVSTMYGCDPEYIGFFFQCSKWHNEIKNMEPDQCRELRFFNMDELPDNIVQYMKKGIECAKSKTIFSEIG